LGARKTAQQAGAQSGTDLRRTPLAWLSGIGWQPFERGMIIDGRSGTGRFGMGVTLLGTLSGKFAWQDLQGKACFLNGCQVTGTREGEHRWRQSFRQHFLRR
jgi:hypothetical protein